MKAEDLGIGMRVYSRAHDAFGTVLQIYEESAFVKFSEMFSPPLESEINFDKLITCDAAYDRGGR